MAYVNNTRVGTITLADRVAALMKSVRLAVERRAVYHRTLRELNALNDRDLADLGLHRATIVDVAAEAAYGK
jgi:uncharacterized protein YjiS (DUF1127 family)